MISEIPQSAFIPTRTEEFFGGVGDSLGDMRDGIVYAVNHPIQTAEHMVRMVSDPTYLLEVALATIQDYKNYIESNSGARVTGRVATDVVVGVLVTRGATLGFTALKGATSSVPAPNVPKVTDSPLLLEAPKGTNPWLEGSEIVSITAPKDFKINMAMS